MGDDKSFFSKDKYKREKLYYIISKRYGEIWNDISIDKKNITWFTIKEKENQYKARIHLKLAQRKEIKVG